MSILWVIGIIIAVIAVIVIAVNEPGIDLLGWMVLSSYAIAMLPVLILSSNEFYLEPRGDAGDAS